MNPDGTTTSGLTHLTQEKGVPFLPLNSGTPASAGFGVSRKERLNVMVFPLALAHKDRGKTRKTGRSN
jgi:hypothetical protein